MEVFSMIETNKVLYDIYNNALKIVDCSDYTITLERERVINISFNNGHKKEQHIKKEKMEDSLFDIGIKYFYSYSDYEDHKKGLIKDQRYFFNQENIENFFKNEAILITNEIREKEPQGVLMNEEEKDEIVAEYYKIRKEEADESIFFSKYNNMDYFGRIDLDTHYYKKDFESYWDKHYYQRLYITNKYYKDIGNGIHFVNWRSPIASMYYDVENTSLTRFVDVDIVNDMVRGVEIYDKKHIYNHELMLKRKFSSFKPINFQNTYICGGDDIYLEGSVDPFLMQVLSENRKRHEVGDIIKTIQSNQNSIIRAEKEKNIIVQGCAGSGKTMILLHRLSYLKFNKLLPGKNSTKIITPSDYFSKFINDLSNTLELDDIERVTMFDYFVSVCKKYQAQYSTVLKKSISGEVSNKREVSTNKKALEYYSENEISDMGYSYAYEDITALGEKIPKLYEEKITAFMQEIALDKIKNIAERLEIIFPDKNALSDKIFLDRIYDIVSSTIPRSNTKILEKISDNRNRIDYFEEKIKRLEERLQFLEDRIRSNKIIKLNHNDFINDEISDIELQKNKLSIFDLRRKRALNKTIKNMKSLLLVDGDDSEHSETLDFAISNKVHSFKIKFATDVIHLITDSIALINYENEFSKTKGYEKINREISLLREIINNAIAYEKINNVDTYDYFKIINIFNDFQRRLEAIYDLFGTLIDSWENEKNRLVEEEQRMANIVVDEEEKTLLNYTFIELSRRGLFVIDTFLYLRDNILRKENVNEDCFISNKNEACALAYLYALHCSTTREADHSIFIDEGQDYSYLEYKVIRLVNGEKCVLNVFGDINQRVEFLNTMPDWKSLKNLLCAEVYTLNENYRNTVEITDYVNKELNFKIFPIGIHGTTIRYIDKNELEHNLRQFLDDNKKLRVALISLDENYLKEVKSRLMIKELFAGTVVDVKGLEFDIVFVHDQDMNTNERYISYTRALENLIIVR